MTVLTFPERFALFRISIKDRDAEGFSRKFQTYPSLIFSAFLTIIGDLDEKAIVCILDLFWLFQFCFQSVAGTIFPNNQQKSLDFIVSSEKKMEAREQLIIARVTIFPRVCITIFGNSQ